jgi:hypothetical protein
MVKPRSALVLVVLSVVVLSVAGHRDGAEGGSAVKPPCAWVAADTAKPVAGIDELAKAYVRVDLAPDLGHLDATERAVLDELVAAGEIMNKLFRIQATPCYEELASLVRDYQGPEKDALTRYFAINYGPWDRRQHLEPYFGAWPHPDGANFYPLDLTDAEKARLADPAAGFNGLTTMVRRDEAGALQAIPYGTFFAAQLTEAAGHLRAAAARTQNASLKAFLTARADAFLSDDYYVSDGLWMDVDSPVEVTIGPYETYEDGLFGFKASFEAFVTVTDPVQSQRLAKYKDELPWLEQHLPLPDADKNPNRGSESPIRVVDLVYSGGDTRAGVQTIAFNLPNDERVREAKGSKKVLMRNVMDAKFKNILTPIAERLIAADQLADVTAESFFLHTLWHEMSHGLGPGRIVVDGRETEVRLEHKDLYSTLEEAKADLMGIWDILALQAAGRDYFPAQITRQQPATYLAGLFRSVRFGIGEAHGAANAIQFNYLLEKGAVVLEEKSGKYRVDQARFFPAVESLLHEILTLQARGDYAGAAALVKTYAVMPASLAKALQRLEGIPVDIQPVFTHYPDA